MSSVQVLPTGAPQLTEFEALFAAAPSVLDAIPGAVYLCDSEGWVVRYNSEAAELWGRSPEPGEDRFCGSLRLFLPDGTLLPHEVCPMADAVQSGTSTRNAEVVIERPDGTRINVLVNIRALTGQDGEIQGAINCLQDISALKQMEQEVLRTNRDLEDFFENSAVGLHIVSGDGIILRANKAELELLGYSADEYVGRHITEFHIDPPVIGEILDQLSCGGKLERYPARLRAKDGSIKHVLITSNSRFENGKFLSTRCFTTDITELRQAESARRETDERLAATYEAATVGIAETDESGRYVRVNDAMCRILGRSREEVLASDILSITLEEDRQTEAEHYSRQVSGELASYTLQKRAFRPEGSIVHLEVSSSSVRDAEGKFRYGVRVMQDVTERKRMQDEIRASEHRLRELLQGLPAAIYTTDVQGRVTFYNDAAVELAGRVPELGSDQWCVTWRLERPNGTPLPHDECPMAVALKEKRAIRGGEAVAEKPDGTKVPFLAYPTPLFDAEGTFVGAVNMLVDITDRKEAEIRQKGLIDELNHRVKNTLATVQSLALQTARHAASTDDFAKTFEARLVALSKAHDLLTKRHWAGAGLQSLLEDLLAPFDDNHGRTCIEGPPFELNPRAALSVTMALNELATNAAKYGGLSRPEGSLSIRWNIGSEPGGLLVIDWIEQGGPQVSTPSRQGFGTRLLKRCIERDLDGEITLAYDLEGVRCRMSMPLSVLTAHG